MAKDNIKEVEVKSEVADTLPSLISPEEKEKIDLENRLLRLKLAREEADLQDIQERLQERELKRVQIKEKARNNGQTLNLNMLDKARKQNQCNHRKGGNGMEGYTNGQGASLQYAVVKHRFLNGDTWIRCQRCAKTWKPPAKSQHTSQESYDLAWQAYRNALEYPTQNITSSSYEFRFSDGGENFREIMKDVNLH